MIYAPLNNIQLGDDWNEEDPFAEVCRFLATYDVNLPLT